MNYSLHLMDFLDMNQICCELSVDISRPEFSLYHVFPQKCKPLPLPVLYIDHILHQATLNPLAAKSTEFNLLQPKLNVSNIVKL